MYLCQWFQTVGGATVKARRCQMCGIFSLRRLAEPRC